MITVAQRQWGCYQCNQVSKITGTQAAWFTALYGTHVPSRLLGAAWICSVTIGLGLLLAVFVAAAAALLLEVTLSLMAMSVGSVLYSFLYFFFGAYMGTENRRTRLAGFFTVLMSVGIATVSFFVAFSVGLILMFGVVIVTSTLWGILFASFAIALLVVLAPLLG